MFKKCIFILATSCMMYSCTTQTETNPFLTEFQTEHGVPPFDKIKLEHYEPAFLKGIEEQNANIDAIVNNSEAPTFENVIVALDNSSPILDRVSAIFYNMTEAETTDDLKELSIKLAPTLSEHSDNISLNQDLFKKVDAVYQQKDALGLTTEQQRLLEETYKGFVRSGANLSPEKQARLREVNKELSTLGIKFSDNVLNENNAFKLYIDKEEDLAGLPDWFRQSAAEKAKEDGQEGKGEKLEAWDWWFYTEKLRKEKYNLEEDEIKPYFKLENVREGAFAVANKLYGITLTKLEGIPVYHPDVEVFEVKDADGSHLGVFYVDYFPRPGKSGGAWMSNYREQQGAIRPLVCNVCSFTQPVGDIPSLLTIDEVETLFHEFGHALHGLLTKCNYKGISGTNVARDFVELPSQINEHWATEPEVLKMHAKHYQTGETIPDSLIEKILNQKTFNQGFMTTELLAAAILDMNLHNLTDTQNLDVLAYEKEAMDKLGLIPEIAPRYRTTYFNHIIGGYAAGYYSYLWANVLDNDAFEAFKEHGIFDKKTADLFRNNVLEKGNSEDPMTLYKNFRGTEPQLEPMLKNRGMK